MPSLLVFKNLFLNDQAGGFNPVWACCDHDEAHQLKNVALPQPHTKSVFAHEQLLKFINVYTLLSQFPV